MDDDDFGWFDAFWVTVAVLFTLWVSSPVWYFGWDIYIP
jgi:hypothetical protein